MKLSAKMLALVAGGMFVTIVSVVLASGILQRNALLSDFSNQVGLSTELLAGTTAGAIRFKKAEKIEESFTAFWEGYAADLVWIAAVDSNGDVIFSTGTMPERKQWGKDLVSAALNSQQQSTLAPYLVAQPIFFGKKNTFVGGIVIQWSSERVLGSVQARLLTIVGLGLTISLVVLAVCGLALNAAVIRPILGIDFALQELAEERYDTEISGVKRRDEIGEMARNIVAFKGALSDAAQARLEQKSNRDRIDKERRAVILELNSGVGSVVTAAEMGRFDQRVNLERSSEFAIIGDGVNKLCENVEAFIEDLQASVESLAMGDLTRHMNDGHSGRFSQTASDFNAAMERFDSALSEVSSSVGEMNTSIKHVNTSSGELSERSMSQAVALKETNAAMQFVTSTASETKTNAHEISQYTKEAELRAKEGREVVNKAVSAMDGIKEQSKQISDITTTIDGIAFQTNLLALNAAVEAARAGDAGKGFAVVASEVRGLAQRAGAAAADIKRLIQTSQERVEDGETLVNESGAALQRISDAILNVSLKSDTITVAAKEQADSVDEIFKSISHLDANTQQNARVADESANASDSLSQQAEKLHSVTAAFVTSAGSSACVLL